jgi:indolepyruvate decarboxylase
MTAQELGSAARFGLPVTYFVLNNQGYGIERLIHAGPAHNDYNDVAGWDYAALGAALGIGARGGGGFSRRVRTEAELARALADLELPEHAGAANLVELWLSPDDASDALRRLGESIKVKNRLS